MLSLAASSRRVSCGAIFLALAGTLLSCGKGEEAVKVDLSQRETTRKASTTKPIRIAVSAMISPKETFSYYKELLDYIGLRLAGRADAVQLVQRKTYAEVNALLERREIDAAFVCAGPYVDGHRKFGMELVAAPSVNGKAVYYSYAITHIDSPAKTLADLQGRRFAFTDPDSNTGCLVPRYELARSGKSADSFFKEIIFTGGHDNSIRAVSEKFVEGAAVDNLIWEYLHAKKPEAVARTRVLERWGPYAMPPFVVHPGCAPDLKNRLREILLGMREDPKGRDILAKLNIDRFVPIEDDRYESVRAMQEWLKGHRQKTPAP